MEETSFGNRLKWIGIAFLIVFSFLFLGGIHIGPISVRMAVAYGLLVYVLLRGESDYLPTNGMKMYFLYVAVYLLVNILNYTAFSSVFFKDLMAVHFVCCIAIFAFPRIFKTEESIQGAFFVIVFGYLLNALVTILQAQDIAMGWSIGMFINPTEIEELEELQSKMVDTREAKASVIMGIMGRSVGNGYFVATFLPVLTYYVWDKFHLKTLWAFFIIAITAVCIYFIQQRMALVVVATYILCVILLRRAPSLVKFFAFSVALLLILYYFDSIVGFDYTQAGRLSDFADEARSNTLSVFNDFIRNPKQLLFGNNQITTDEEKQIFLVIGHNTFTDTFRRGGLILFLPFVVLFFCLCKTLIGVLLFSRDVEDYRTMGMAIGCICFLLYSQTHSTGVQSGSIMFWTLYMLTIQSHRVRCEAIEAEEMEEEEDVVE